MLNRRRFALHFAMTAALGLTPLAAAPLARAEESTILPDTYRGSPRRRGGRGRPRRSTAAAAGTATPGPRAKSREQLELRPGTALTATK